MELITKIKQIDQTILANEEKIKTILANESHLKQAHEISLEKEHEATQTFTKNPTTDNQEILDAARDFSQSCQRKVNLFKDGSGQVKSDIAGLHIIRKKLVKELSDCRSKAARPNMEAERQQLLEILYPSFIRLMNLTAHLDGQLILQLDINRMMLKYNERFKFDLDDAKVELKDQFEKVYDTTE